MIKDRGSSSSSSSSTSSQLPHHPPHTRKPKLALLREVFGRGGFVLIIYHLKCTTNDYFQAIDYIFKELTHHFCTKIAVLYVLISCFSLQVRSFAGFFLSTPAPHQLAASPTPPCPTMTSDLCERGEDVEKGFVCV